MIHFVDLRAASLADLTAAPPVCASLAFALLFFDSFFFSSPPASPPWFSPMAVASRLGGLLAPWAPPVECEIASRVSSELNPGIRMLWFRSGRSEM